MAVFPAEVKVERDELKVSRRDITGKKVKLLRKEGITPVNLYGPNIQSVSLQAETALVKRLLGKAGRNALISLKLDGDKKPKMVMVRDIQRDPLNDALLHVDFFQVEMTHKVRADVPLKFVGESPVAKGRRAMVIESLTAFHVEALPADLPRNIEVDLSRLQAMDQAIHVRDIVVPDGVVVLTDLDQVIVKVMEAKVEVVEEAVAVGAVAEEGEEVAEEAEAAPAEAEAKGKKKEAPEAKAKKKE